MPKHRVPAGSIRLFVTGIAVAGAALALASTPASTQQALVSDDPRYCVAASGALTGCTTEQNLFSRTYQARNAFVFEASAGCLDGSGGKGNPVRLSACNGSLGQDWYIVRNRQIQNKANNLCLDVKNERFEAGNPVVLWDCRPNKNNQNFGMATVLAATGESSITLASIRQTLKDGTIEGRNLIQSGEGYVIAAGGYNVIAAGGANVVGAGGGNAQARGAAKGPAGELSPTTEQVIAAGGANVIAAGGANVIAAGGANADGGDASVIGAGGANVIAAGGANVIAAGGANYTTLSTTEPAASGQLSVGATSNIFASGRSVVPEMYYGGGTLPPVIPVAGMSKVAFPEVSGGVSFTGYSDGHPDGVTDYPLTNIEPYQGISGVVHDNRIMFLVGVFLADGEPTEPAPESIDLTTANESAAFAPGLQQVFFIGDGKTASGEVQVFAVPAGATRLFLGFADSNGFTGAPATYGDNNGELAVGYRVYP